MPYTTVVAGTTITAAWGNANVRDQSVTPHASAAARTSAVTAPVEGMLHHLNDVNTFTVYSGAAWSTIGPVHGAGIAWTPTVTQSGSVAVTVTAASYFRWGRMVTCRMKVVCTGTGTAANAVTIGGLPVAALTTVGVNGTGFIYDASVGNYFPGMAALITSTTIQIYSSVGGTSPALGVTSFTAALTTNDEIHATFTYEAAGDA